VPKTKLPSSFSRSSLWWIILEVPPLLSQNAYTVAALPPMPEMLVQLVEVDILARTPVAVAAA
jgi:hypothetical protein